MLLDEDFEFFLEEVRIQAFLNPDDAELDDFLGDHALRGLALELRPHGNQNQIRGADAVNGRDERDGDTLTDLRRIIEHGHDVNQAEHGADDTDRGRVTARAFENFSGRLFFLECEADFRIDDFFDGIGLEAVDDVLDVLLEHRILDAFALSFDGEHAFFSSDGRDLDDLVDVGTHVEVDLEENRRKHLECALDVAARKRKEHRAESAAEHDDRRRTLKDLADVAPLEELASDDRDHSEENTD